MSELASYAQLVFTLFSRNFEFAFDFRADSYRDEA